MSDLTQTITATNGVHIKDVMRFFKDDSPAQQFERGTNKADITSAEHVPLI